MAHATRSGGRGPPPASYHRANLPDVRSRTVPGYHIVHRLAVDPVAERRSLVAGLLASPASIAPKYFYDVLGCALYGAICELPEYYPTRTERSIFNQYRAEIARAIGTADQFVDLGAGDCCKAESWLAFLATRRYVAVDIAAEGLNRALARLAPAFPDVELLGVVTDFAAGLDLADDLAELPTTFFYPGSSIGNYAPDEAVEFLRAIRRHCTVPGSGLLMGVDTKKDKARLEAAYDDPLGVTAAFNRNVLSHVNRVLGCDFVTEAFVHRAFYDAGAGRIEMHLEATSPQAVILDGTRRTFAAGERIHTENSYKYAPAEAAALLTRAGFAGIHCWQDPNGDFSVLYAE